MPSVSTPTVKFNEDAKTTIAAIKARAKETLRTYLQSQFSDAAEDLMGSCVNDMIDGGRLRAGGRGTTDFSASATKLVSTAQKRLAQDGWKMTDAVWRMGTPLYQADTLKISIHAFVEQWPTLKWTRVFSTQLCSLELELDKSAEDEDMQDLTMTEPEQKTMTTCDQKLEDSMGDPMNTQETSPAKKSEEELSQTMPILPSLFDQFSSHIDDIFKNRVQGELDECDHPSVQDWHKNAKRLYPEMCTDLLSDLGLTSEHDDTTASRQVYVEPISKAETGYEKGCPFYLLHVPLRGTVTHGEQTLGSSDWDLIVDNRPSADI